MILRVFGVWVAVVPADDGDGVYPRRRDYIGVAPAANGVERASVFHSLCVFFPPKKANENQQKLSIAERECRPLFAVGSHELSQRVTPTKHGLSTMCSASNR